MSAPERGRPAPAAQRQNDHARDRDQQRRDGDVE